jgi:hypothetical protein
MQIRLILIKKKFSWKPLCKIYPKPCRDRPCVVPFKFIPSRPYLHPRWVQLRKIEMFWNGQKWCLLVGWGPLDANPNDSSGQVCFKLAKWFQMRKSSIGWICIFDQKKVQITKIMEKHLIYKQLITLQISNHFRLKIVAFLSISKHFYFS